MMAALLLPLSAFGQNLGAPMPFVQPQFFGTTSGAACAGCLLYSYAAGTTTPLATYTDATLATANANPIVLNTLGRPSGSSEIWLSAQAYKFVLQTAAGATIWTQDNVYDFAQIAGTTLNCAAQTGASASIKITACANALPTTGGTTDVRGLTGVQGWTTDAFNGITKPIDFICEGTTFTVSTNSTIPANVNLILGEGCIFSVNNALTLTIKGSMVPSVGQHFAGTGSVLIATASATRVLPQWFGAVGDGSTDDSTAWKNTFAAVSTSTFTAGGANGNLIECSGNYKITSTLTLPRSARIVGVTRRGVLNPPNAYGCGFLQAFSGVVLQAIPGSRTAYDLYLGNMIVYGNASLYPGVDCIQLSNVTDVTLEQMVVSNCGRYGINTGPGSDNVHIRDVYASQSTTADFYFDSSDSTCVRCVSDAASSGTGLLTTANAAELFVEDGFFESNTSTATGVRITAPRVHFLGNYINNTQGGNGFQLNTTSNSRAIIEGNRLTGNAGQATGNIGIDIQSSTTIEDQIIGNFVGAYGTAFKNRSGGVDMVAGNIFEGVATGCDVTAVGSSGWSIYSNNYCSGPTNSLIHNSGNGATYTTNHFDNGSGTYLAPTITAGTPNFVPDHVLQAVVWNNAAQSTANITYTVLTWNQEEKNTDGMHSTSVNPTRLIAPIPGQYQVCGEVDFATNNTGGRIFQVRKNAAGLSGGGTLMFQVAGATVTGSGDDTMITGCREIAMSSNDYVELFAYQSSTGNLNVQGSQPTTWFSLEYRGQ